MGRKKVINREYLLHEKEIGVIALRYWSGKISKEEMVDAMTEAYSKGAKFYSDARHEMVGFAQHVIVHEEEASEARAGNPRSYWWPERGGCECHNEDGTFKQGFLEEEEAREIPA